VHGRARGRAKAEGGRKPNNDRRKIQRAVKLLSIFLILKFSFIILLKYLYQFRILILPANYYCRVKGNLSRRNCDADSNAEIGKGTQGTLS